MNQNMAIGQIFDDLRDPRGAGFAVTVLQGGDVTYRECAGLANVEDGELITPDTRFHVVSCGKTFTAAAIVRLAARGKLDLADSIANYLPELPAALFAEGPVTIRDLLSMTSGLKDGLELLRLRGSWRALPGRVRELRHLAQAVGTRNAAPGARYIYTNTNYVLLEWIIERLSGRPADALRAEEIYRPLGLVDTMARYDQTAPLARLAKGYVPLPAGGYCQATDLLGIAGDPIVSSLRDLTRWLQTWRRGEIDGVDFISPMAERRRLNDGSQIYYGLGLALRRYRGLDVWCHSGSQPGYKAHLAFMPEADIGFVMVSNRDDAAPATRLAPLLDQLLTSDHSAKISASSHSLDLVTIPQDGIYFDPLGHELISLRREGPILLGETLGDPFHLYPGADGVLNDGDDYRANYPVALAVDPVAPDRCTITAAGYHASYRRLPAYDPALSALEACVGGYECPQSGTRIGIEMSDEGALVAAYGTSTDGVMTFPMQALAPDIFLVRPTAPGIAFKHVFVFHRDAGIVEGVEVTMERLKRHWLERSRF